MEILNSRFKDMGEFMNTKPICLFMIFVFVFLLLACKPSTDQSNRSTPSDDSADSGDSPPEGGLVEDCGVTVDIYVWLDENANGVVDSGEKPVPNVVVGLDGASQQTDKYGKATAGTFTTCCTGDCWIGHSALVEIPNGYNPTTPTEVPLTEKVMLNLV